MGIEHSKINQTPSRSPLHHHVSSLISYWYCLTLSLFLPLKHPAQPRILQMNIRAVAAHVNPKNPFPRSALTPIGSPYLSMTELPLTATAVVIALATPRVINAMAAVNTSIKAERRPPENIQNAAARIVRKAKTIPIQ